MTGKDEEMQVDGMQRSIGFTIVQAGMGGFIVVIPKVGARCVTTLEEVFAFASSTSQAYFNAPIPAPVEAPPEMPSFMQEMQEPPSSEKLPRSASVSPLRAVGALLMAVGLSLLGGLAVTNAAPTKERVSVIEKAPNFRTLQ